MSDPTGRYRVALTTVMGRTWFDLYNRDEAIRRAQAERKAGAEGVEVLQEFESDNRWAADFRRIWP